MKITDNLYEKLSTYGKSDYYPFHMPGHKRNDTFLKLENFVKSDITEIDGFDNLHKAKSIILAAEKRASALYDAKETHFLVNGSSVGLLAAICGSCSHGDQILIARNCHKSVYHAVELFGLMPVYIYPHIHEKYGIYEGIDASDTERILKENPDIKAVVITSPTYEGIVSDIGKIADVVHRFHIPLIVDEAHGAHFGFHESFPKGALSFGADIVIHSVHKTLPSLTQTALLHMKGDIADRASVRKYLTYFQTSSPSYLFMASIDRCMALIEGRGHDLFETYDKKLNHFYKNAGELTQLELLGKEKLTDGVIYDFDKSKIVVFSNTVSACGNGLYDILLKKYHLQMEMASRDYVLAMTSFCDTDGGFLRLYSALRELDGALASGELSYRKYPRFETEAAKPEMTIEAAVSAESRAVPLYESEGFISAEYAYIYPPGVPFLVPGERITKKHLMKIKSFAEEGFDIEGFSDAELKFIHVIV